MRTTLTLDDDLVLRLKEQMRRDGTSFKRAVNRALRRGIAVATKSRFRVRARSLGLRPGVNYSKTSEMLDWLDEIGGRAHRRA